MKFRRDSLPQFQVITPSICGDNHRRGALSQGCRSAPKKILDIGHAVVRHTSPTTDPLYASTYSRARKRMNRARTINKTPSVNRASSASRSRAGFPSRKPSNPAKGRGCFRAYTTGSDHA